MEKDKILYFAYGSNLDVQQIQKRCPSARFVCKAHLKNHRLDFTRKSINRNCGVADAVHEPGSDVWGVVYEIDRSEMRALNSAEGYKPCRRDDLNAYNRRPCQVTKHDSDEAPICVQTYFAVKQKKPPLPGKEYRQLIVEGAKHWELSADYVKKLESIEFE